MDTPSFQLNSVWQARASSGESFILSYFNGTSNFALFPSDKDGGRKPIAKLNMSQEAAIRLYQILNKLQKENPGTRMSFHSSTYNKDERKFETGAGMSLVFVKDDRKCYHIEVTSKTITTPIIVKVMAGQTFSTDGGTRSDGLRSEDKLLSLMDVMAKDLMLRTLSRFGTREQLRGGSGRGNSGDGNNNYRRDNNYNRNANMDPYGKQASDASSSSSSDDDDIPF